MRHFYTNLYNSTEIAFYHKFKIFPLDLYEKLLKLGYSRQSFQGIQKQMDILFAQEKNEAEWFQTDFNPFEPPAT